MDNYIYILFFCVFAISTINFIYTDYDVIEPINFFSFTALFSVGMATLYVYKWDLYIGSFTCLLIVLGILSFSLGGYVIDGKIKFKYAPDNHIFKELFFTNTAFIILVLTMITLFFFSFNEIYQLSLKLGNTEGVSNIIKTVRYPLERQEVRFSRWDSYRNYIAEVTSYVSMYIFLSNLVLSRIKKTKYLLLSLLYIPFTIISTGRMSIFKYLIYCMTLFSILYLSKNNYSMKSKKSIIYVCLVFFIVFVSLFFFYGMFTGKVISDNRTPITILAHYAGLSYPALDVYLDSVRCENYLIGSNTLKGIYNNLISIGFNFPRVNVFLEFVDFNGINTNVYSCFRRYIDDYGVSGMCLILVYFGMMFTFFYRIIKQKANLFITILYSSLVWTIVMSFHDEKFLMTLVDTSIIYKNIILYFMVKYLVKMKSIDNKEHPKMLELK